MGRIYDSIIETIGNMYNEALIVIENNSIGQYVSWTMWNVIEYENLYFDYERKVPGIRTTISSIGSYTLIVFIPASTIKAKS